MYSIPVYRVEGDLLAALLDHLQLQVVLQVVQCTVYLYRVEGDRLAALLGHVQLQVVLQVGPNTGQVMHHLHSCLTHEDHVIKGNFYS